MAGIRVVVNIHVNPGNEEALREEWVGTYELVNAEPGCLQYELMQSTTTPTNFAILEHWADKVTYDAHWEAESNREIPYAHLLDWGARVTGKDGAEFHDQQYFMTRDGKWVPVDDSANS
ncbi:putative quinol monooxygenase [Amycolatopsis sp. GM8]|uniref:putative quinol monooxygenase n=1 Tax=Amycolatopsis sp. GM8 TaxID=2896530 RepID=UPI001F33B341|nr:antibiotic biosynthesis monooxygenase [Amycolatopsis sp. GM8]